MKKILISILILFLLVQSSIAQQLDNAIDYAKLEKLIAFCDTTTEATEVLIFHKNKQIAYWKDADCDSVYMNTSSMVKSWTGLLIGILIDKKIIDSINAPVSKYVPEWKAGVENNITIKHLLTMTSGIKRRSGNQGILAEKDMYKYMINFEPDTLPGIQFGYSNESVQMLSMVIESATKMNANDAFSKYLFDPLEMDSSGLVRDSAGNYIVFGGARTTISNASKVGKLMEQNGKYKGKQIVSEQWLIESVSPGKLAPYYGYLWWIDNVSPNHNFAATGDGGQLTIIFPELDLIFLRNQKCFPKGGHKMPWMGPYFLNLIADIVIK